MSEKLTEITKVSALDDSALFYAVDPIRSTGDKDVSIDKNDLREDIGVNTKEDSLGNPSSNNQVLASQTDGTRSWVNQSDSSLWAEYLGTWINDNGVLSLGDISNENNGTKIEVNDGDGSINFYFENILRHRLTVDDNFFNGAFGSNSMYISNGSFSSDIRATNLTSARVLELPDKTDTLAVLGDLPKGETIADTGATITLTTEGGTNCNFDSVNSNVSFTLVSTDVINSWSEVFINTTTEPVLTHATKTITQVSGSEWVANTDLFLLVRDLGASGFFYRYATKAVGSGGGVTTLEQAITANPIATTSPTFDGGMTVGSGTVAIINLDDGEGGTIVADSEALKLDHILGVHIDSSTEVKVTTPNFFVNNKEVVVSGSRSTESISTSKTIDWYSNELLDLNVTGLTELIDSNLPSGVNTKEIKINATGGYLSKPSAWKRLSDSGNYIGALSNFITVNCVNGNSDNEIIYYKNQTTELEYDYVIDAVNGSDSNNGLTEVTAWQTLSNIDNTLLIKGEKVNILVKSGNYDDANDYILIQSGANDVLDAILNIVFEEGTVIDGVNMAGSENGVEQSGDISWTLNIIGNGLRIQNFVDASGTSPNGIGNRDVSIINIYDVDVINCEDGFSSHDDAFMNIYNCSASACDKSPFLHVNNATVNAYNSIFIEKTGGGTASMAVTDSASNCNITATNCTWLPDSSSVQSKFTGTYNRCQMGNLTTGITLSTSNSNVATFNNSYINIYMDGNSDAVFDTCYGKFSTRVRTGGTLDFQNNIITSPASGQTNVVFSNFNSGGANTIVCNNNIFEMATGFMSVDSNNATHLVNASAQFFNNSLFGGVTYDADLVSADAGGTVIVDTLTSDPLIGIADTLLMSDYGYGVGSPCIGAGTIGSNIGFSESESVKTGYKK